jgi:hypothetical protein
LWQAIIRTHKVDTVSNVDAVKDLVARKAYQNIKQGSFETLTQYSVRFHDTYKAYKAIATQERPVDVAEQDQALDFFHGLDQGRYAQFKTSMLNGWATKAFDPPETPNDIYHIAGVWVKPTSKIEGGTAVSFVTIEEEARINKKHMDENKREEKKKKVVAAATAAAHATGGTSKESKQEHKVPKDLSHIECFRCKQPGHYSTSKECPLHPDNKKQKAKAGFINTTWADNETSIFVTIYEEGEHEEHMINNAVHVTQGLKPTKVLLDNQANISIVHPMLLKNVRPAPKKIVIKGVGGPQLIVDQVGDLEGFFKVYVSEYTKANILSFADIEDMYKVTYKRGATFVVRMQDRNVEFKCREKLYVVDWVVDTYACATVQENALVYTKEELRRAKEVYELVRNSGYPSPNDAMHLLTDGNIRGMPVLTVADLQRAYKVYGIHPEYVRGQLTKKKVSRVQVDLGLRSTDKNLRLYADVMHLEGSMFLVTVADPLNLTKQSYVENKGRMSLCMALQGQLSLLKSHGFEPRIVYMDPHSSFRSMTQEFPGTDIDIGRANDHVAKVDANIRRIKEMARKVKAGLPWELPGQLFKDLVTYAMSRINIRRTTALSENVCPRVLFMGMPIDYKKELQLAFGDYVEVYKGTTNNMVARSAACIALFPAANSTGSWVLWKIDTRCKVRRSNKVKLVTMDAIITTMNAIAEEDTLQARDPQHRGLAELLSRQPTEVEASRAEEPEESPDETQERNHESGEDKDEESAEESRAPEAETEASPQHVTTRSGRLVTRPSRYALVTKVARSAWEEQAAKIAIEKELWQLIEELVVIVPVKCTSILADVTILKSHMFLVNKYLGDGSFDNVKARLVADGRDQDAELFPNKSSLMVAIHSVFTVLALACQKHWRVVAKIDSFRTDTHVWPTNIYEVGSEDHEDGQGNVPRV